MDIDVLPVADCPNAAPATGLVRHVLDSLGLRDTPITTRVITDQAEAEAAWFTGSPTFLVDGRDPFAESGRAPGLSCRIYRTPGGLAGLPDAEQMHRVLSSTLLADRVSGNVRGTEVPAT